MSSDLANLFSERELRALESVETQISQIIAAHDAVANQVVDASVALKRQRNALARIHSLPPEIFSYVLLKSLNIHLWKVSDSIKLASVCRYWSDTVSSSALFWPTLHCQNAEDTLAFVLEKNATADLRVVIEGYGVAKRKRLLKLASPVSRRWRSLRFQGPVPKFLLEYLDVPTPRLIDLTLICWKDLSAPVPHFPLSDGATLRNLHLELFTIPWDSDRLTRLRSLHLGRLRSNVPTTSQLHTMLSSSPNLWYLNLTQWDDEAPAGTKQNEELNGSDHPHIPLPNLSYFSLENVPHHITDYLLATIDSPGCPSVWLNGVHTKHFEMSGFLALITPAIQASLRCIEIVFNATDESLMIRSWASFWPSHTPLHNLTEKPGYYIHLRRQKLLDCRKALAEFMHTTNMTSVRWCRLRVDGLPDTSQTNPSSTFPVEILHDWPFVHSIEFPNRYQLSHVFRYLEEPRRNGSGKLEWVCPRLYKLCLPRAVSEQAAVIEDVVDFITKRNGRLRIPHVLAGYVRSRFARIRMKESGDADMASVWGVLKIRKIAALESMTDIFKERKLEGFARFKYQASW